VDGFEASSGGELQWLHDAAPGMPLLLSGPGKTDAELTLAVELGVELVHVESLLELRRLAGISERLGRRVGILLRLNLPLPAGFETSLVMGGRPTPFGLDPAELPAALDLLTSSPSLELRGLHFHLLSHQLDAARHASLLEHYVGTFLALRERHHATWTVLNVGGGIGINYREPGAQFSWESFARALAPLGARCRSSGLEVVRFELGRFITAACGYYAVEVLDVKRTFGKTFVVCRGGTHHFRTPQAQGHSHPFRVVARERWTYPFERPGVRRERVNIVGQLCTPKDVLAHDSLVEEIRVGDVVVFPYAGAYAWNISHQNFLMHPPPQERYLRQGSDGC